MNRFNERAWAGQIISWIKEEIYKGTTIFQDATNDEGIKVASGRTKFPDILLFIDKISGIIFNGWELKFPDTAVDDPEMLLNALEKAARLKSSSFVTWNGIQAIIWQIHGSDYTIGALTPLKVYPKMPGVNNRNDLSEKSNYLKREPKLQKQLLDILHDLQQLYQDGKLQEAINISDELIGAVGKAAVQIIPQFKVEIDKLKGVDADFRSEFNKWKIIETATLKILSSSSRRVEHIDPEEILAKFIFYKLIGKILFYMTLSENLSGRISKLTLINSNELKVQFQKFFNEAQKIDYQAVFTSDFTDKISFNKTAEKLIFDLIGIVNNFDFKILPSSVISNILENLVPKDEKQKFGQYFTSESLTILVTLSAVKNKNFLVFDPTSGTGTFLNTFYNTLKFYGNNDHQILLSQIWGNDISHFPAVLSVINLYKQKVEDTANFPRVTRKDFFIRVYVKWILYNTRESS